MHPDIPTGPAGTNPRQQFCPQLKFAVLFAILRSVCRYPRRLLSAGGRLLAGLFSVDEEGYSHTSAVIAYKPNGQTDSSFGSWGDGTVILFGSSSGAYIAPQSNNKIVTAGTRSLTSEVYYNVVIEHLKADGKKDSSFGTNCITILPTDFDGRRIDENKTYFHHSAG